MRIFVTFCLFAVILPVLSACADKPQGEPSKIYGQWKLVSLDGLEQAFDDEERENIDRRDVERWDEAKSKLDFRLTYRLNREDNETMITLSGCNPSSSLYEGVIHDSLDDITFKKGFPQTLLACAFGITDESGELRSNARAPIDIAVSVFSLKSTGKTAFRLIDDDQILVFEHTGPKATGDAEFARFKRIKAAQ